MGVPQDRLDGQALARVLSDTTAMPPLTVHACATTDAIFPDFGIIGAIHGNAVGAAEANLEGKELVRVGRVCLPPFLLSTSLPAPRVLINGAA